MAPIIERLLGKSAAGVVTALAFLALLVGQLVALPQLAETFSNQFLRWWVEGLLAVCLLMSWWLSPSRLPLEKVFWPHRQPLRLALGVLALVTLITDVASYASTPFIKTGRFSYYTTGWEPIAIHEADAQKLRDCSADFIEFANANPLQLSEEGMESVNNEYQGPVAQVAVLKEPTIKEVLLSDCVVHIDGYQTLDIPATVPPQTVGGAGVPPIRLYVSLDANEKEAHPCCVATPNPKTQQYEVFRWGSRPVSIREDSWDAVEVRFLGESPGLYTVRVVLTFTPDHVRSEEIELVEGWTIGFLKKEQFNVELNDYIVDRDTLELTRYAESHVYPVPDQRIPQLAGLPARTPTTAKGRWGFEERIYTVPVWIPESGEAATGTAGSDAPPPPKPPAADPKPPESAEDDSSPPGEEGG
ncbi:hypothetical protein [Botrimarina mediterranea]|uniref:hypothetical protein n=1 Tax=Botrimarina mediterranea TaxID=2528022 RepID=UPI00119D400A|nr:hypothetical protein [Botrimarina mediterranea]